MNSKAKWILPIVAVAIFIAAFFVLRKPKVIAHKPEPQHIAKVVPVSRVQRSEWPQYVTTRGEPGGNWTLTKPSYMRDFEYLYLNPSRNPLHLTKEQVDAFIDCYSKLAQDRLAYEASIAKVDEVDGKVYIDIPSFPQEGVVLKQQFMVDLTARLGSEIAAAIEKEYMAQIVAWNAQMGDETQQMLAEKDPDNPGRVRLVEGYQSTNGLSHGTRTSQLLPQDGPSFGALAQYFPQP